MLPLPPDTLKVTIDNLSVYADPLLEKVFYNLVENALRYGSGLTHITFSQEATEDGIVLLCEDDGCGIAAQHKEGIFNHQHFKDAGFGLFLSREILSITTLSIHETGEAGKGARFEISVPRGYFKSGQEIS
jgi:K+-sensing histidine kinase KdpD